MKWDLVVDLNHPKLLNIRWIHRFFGTPLYLLVRRYDQDTPVGIGTLRDLGQGLRRDLRWNLVFRIFVLSTSGFTEGAIEGIEKEEIEKLSTHDVKLVEERAKGYVLPVIG